MLTAVIGQFVSALVELSTGAFLMVLMCLRLYQFVDALWRVADQSASERYALKHPRGRPAADCSRRNFEDLRHVVGGE